MFGAEPQERLTAEEIAEFEVHTAETLHRLSKQALWATAIFAGTVLSVGPFLAGHSLHGYWEKIGKYLLLLAMGELPWILMRWGFVVARWQSAREVRQEFRDAE